MTTLTVFEWNAWDRFLITHVAPTARPITVMPGGCIGPADLAVEAPMVHINLSRPMTAFPDYFEWLETYAAAGTPVLNGYFGSIDKWAVQDACELAGLPTVRAGRDGEGDEPLVIKARANHYGRYERRLPRELIGDMEPPPWPYPERVHRLLRKDVPAEAWEDPRFAVERFIGNQAGKFMRCYVAGTYAAAAVSYSPDLVKEMDQRFCTELFSTDCANLLPLASDDPLAVTYRLAQQMRVDFAALDLAVAEDGSVYPVDLNTTPIWGNETDLNPRLISELRTAFAKLIASGSQFRPEDNGSSTQALC